tara:strand:- start:3007 stop:3222 length:216 start_codon:yes stop_codon:yes gene_type:complete
MNTINKPILQEKKGKPFNLELKTNRGQTFIVFEGYDHYNDKPIYQALGRNNDHVGDWYNTIHDAVQEIIKL